MVDLKNPILEPANRSPEPITHRPRRLRGSPALRESVAETVVRPSDLILPFFVVPGQGVEEPIASMPGVSRHSVDGFLRGLERALNLGVRSFMLFGVLPDAAKDELGAGALDANGPVPTALRAARQAFGNGIVLYSDVCLCAHTSHGHCGLLRETPRGMVIDNDSSLRQLAAMALTHAEAGVDFVSPSDMMDGRVGYIRQTLDASGHSEVGILAYAVKYASAFYGPFREAAHSAPSFGDRATYQMDPRNAREALREAALDELEGADMMMVKPALPYLDILARLRPTTSLPLVAYNVSGEYAMLKAAVKAGVLDEPRAVRETLHAIKRAGADLIITYHAVEALEGKWL
ncbi:MAG: porphobilinogen synthase [Meiothermus sp.]